MDCYRVEGWGSLIVANTGEWRNVSQLFDERKWMHVPSVPGFLSAPPSRVATTTIKSACCTTKSTGDKCLAMERKKSVDWE